MVVLVLTKLWIDRFDTRDSISAYSDRDRPQEFTTDLEVRRYASGRLRAISTAGEAGQLGFTIVDISLDTVTKLRTWQGVTVQVRDHRGQKWHGIFGGVTAGEYMDPTRYRAGFTLQLVSVVEGV